MAVPGPTSVPLLLVAAVSQKDEAMLPQVVTACLEMTPFPEKMHVKTPTPTFIPTWRTPALCNPGSPLAGGGASRSLSPPGGRSGTARPAAPGSGSSSYLSVPAKDKCSSALGLTPLPPAKKNPKPLTGRCVRVPLGTGFAPAAARPKFSAWRGPALAAGGSGVTGAQGKRGRRAPGWEGALCFAPLPHPATQRAAGRLPREHSRGGGAGAGERSRALTKGSPSPLPPHPAAGGAPRRLPRAAAQPSRRPRGEALPRSAYPGELLKRWRQRPPGPLGRAPR